VLIETAADRFPCTLAHVFADCFAVVKHFVSLCHFIQSLLSKGVATPKPHGIIHVPAFDLRRCSVVPFQLIIHLVLTRVSYPPGRAVQGVDLRLLACWDCGFESRRGMFVSCKCCVVDVSASGRSLDHKSPTDCGVCECDFEVSTLSRPRPTRAVEP